MHTVTEFPNQVVEHENVWIPLADGCRLAARIWLPKNAEAAPVPVILEYLPYRKRDGTAKRDALTHPYFAGHGYAAVRVDMRGNGDSEGLMWDEYGEQEQSDALEVIDWLTAQTWCDGNVGMMGISWGGFNSLQVAALRPPALKAIITLCSTDDRFADDIHYKGGCLLTENLGWASTMLSFSSRPPDPALVGDGWRETWLERLDNQPFLMATWLQHQTRDAYWRHGSICEDWSAIEAATLAVGGWGDAYSNTIPQMIENLTCPSKAIIGPWLHKYPHFAVPGPKIGFLQEALRWWDRWLKGRQTGVENDPAYRIYVMDSVPPQTMYDERPGRWMALEQWPVVGASSGHSWKLAQAQLIPDDDVSKSRVSDSININSAQACGLDGGDYCAMWLGPEFPGDQRLDDALSASFDSAPHDRPMDIVGAPVANLTLTVDKPLALLAVRLCDVRPNGEVTRITYGVLNLCHGRGHEAPEDLAVGQPMTVRVQLDDVAYRVPAGHRLRLAVSTTYWPLVWPSPEAATVKLSLAECELQIPSAPCEELPAETFAQAEAAAGQRLVEVRQESHERKLVRDQATGETVLRAIDDFGETTDLDIGLTAGSIARRSFKIMANEPLTARMETHWTQTLSRRDWRVRTEAHATMRATAESFHLEARVEAYEDDVLFHKKTWRETIPRRNV